MENSNLDIVKVCLVKERSLYSDVKIKTPDDAIRVVARELSTCDREVFCVINIKTTGEPIHLNVVSVGTLNASLISSREVFKSSILCNAYGIIALHNHPSGDCTPSHDDIAISQKLLRAGELLDIPLLDHIIVAGGSNNYYSFNNHNIFTRS